MSARRRARSSGDDAGRGAAGTGRGAGPDWIPVAEAVETVLARCLPLPPEEVSLEAALGRALTEDVTARVDHPPWDNSAMDGFAVRAEEVEGASEARPAELPVSDDIPAGRFPSGPLVPGTAARVMTGAPVPEGATGVVRVEHTDGGRGGRVRIHRDSDARRNIRRRGEDVRRGKVVLRAGDEVTPAAIGVLAMNGVARVVVGRRPRVGVFATGDELAGPGQVEEALAGRRLMNSNTPALAAQLRAAGAEPVALGIARDDRRAVREKVEAAEECDAIVSTAGVSVGEHDEVKAALEELGMERLFWRVRMRPGSPITFGLLGTRPFFGLPGNPVSAMVTCEVFVRAAVRRMAGHRTVHRRRLRARAATVVETAGGLTYFYRVRLQDAPPGARGSEALPRFSLTGPQGSGILTSMAAADGLVVIPEGVERLEPGDVAEVIPLWP